eukprot:Lankesteria_metandrocarpae@DN10805_c0_g1_i1.p1
MELGQGDDRQPPGTHQFDNSAKYSTEFSSPLDERNGMAVTPPTEDDCTSTRTEFDLCGEDSDGAAGDRPSNVLQQQLLRESHTSEESTFTHTSNNNTGNTSGAGTAVQLWCVQLMCPTIARCV